MNTEERTEEPRVWSLPPEPGPEVTRLRDCRGHHWDRLAPSSNGWLPRDAQPSIWATWGRLLTEWGPLTDATPTEEQL